LSAFFEDFSNGVFDGECVADDDRCTCAKVLAGKGKSTAELTKTSGESLISDVLKHLGPFLNFVVAVDVPPQAEPTSIGLQRSAFDVMMASTKECNYLPPQFTQGYHHAKFLLKNKIRDWLEGNSLGWSAACAKTLGLTFVNTLAEAMWYIDRNHDTLKKRGYPVPIVLQQFNGIRQLEKAKKRKIDETFLHQDQMKAHGQSLYNLALVPYLKQDSWSSIRAAVLSLADSMMKYGGYLGSQAKRVCIGLFNTASRAY
jgi:hypothetical protein